MGILVGNIVYPYRGGTISTVLINYDGISFASGFSCIFIF